MFAVAILNTVTDCASAWSNGIKIDKKTAATGLRGEKMDYGWPLRCCCIWRERRRGY
jgi:hypothetical protein